MQQLIEKFKENNINAFFVGDAKAALEKIMEIANGAETIAFAGSKTVEEIGARDPFLKNWPMEKIIDPYETGILPGEAFERRRTALLADLLLTGSNAITKGGEIVNVDAQGNRVAGISFGPKKVIIVVGVNKLVETLADAHKRIKTIAAPMNSKRLKRGNPCEVSGVCENCNSPTRICRIYSVVKSQQIKDRVYVIIVDRAFGF